MEENKENKRKENEALVADPKDNDAAQKGQPRSTALTVDRGNFGALEVVQGFVLGDQFGGVLHVPGMEPQVELGTVSFPTYKEL